VEEPGYLEGKGDWLKIEAGKSDAEMKKNTK